LSADAIEYFDSAAASWAIAAAALGRYFSAISVR
jgi:hypothetical protein